MYTHTHTIGQYNERSVKSIVQDDKTTYVVRGAILHFWFTALL